METTFKTSFPFLAASTRRFNFQAKIIHRMPESGRWFRDIQGSLVDKWDEKDLPVGSFVVESLRKRGYEEMSAWQLQADGSWKSIAKQMDYSTIESIVNG